MSAPRSITVDLAEHWRSIRKRWRLASLAIAVVVGGVFLWTYQQPKVYSGTCSIIIDPAAPKILQGVADVVELGSGGYWAAREFYETQFKIITSDDLAQRVVARLGLANDPDYPVPGGKAAPVTPERLRSLAGAVRDQTQVKPVRDSRIARIVVEDRKPERAAQIANALAAEYIEGNLEQKVEGANNASEWLGGQVVALREKLMKSELTMFEYRKKNQLLDVNLDARQSMNTQNVQSFTQKLADLRAKKIELESSRKIILETRDNIDAQETLPEVRQNQIVQNLRVMYVDLSKTLAEMETTYADKHPKLESLKRKLAIVRLDYVTEIGKILKANENAFRAVEENERGLLKLLDKEKREAIDLAKLEVEYRPLSRDAEDNSNLYKLVTSRQKETSLTGLIKTNNVRILDPAVPNGSPVKPRIVLNMTLALLLGIVIGFGAAIGADVLDNTVKNQEQAEAVLGVPVLGMVPVLGDRGSRKVTPDEQRMRDLSVFSDGKSAAAEACRSIRTNLLFLSADKTLKALVVTSPGPQEGKTTTAINLAITMAQAGARVLLVDTDLRRPRVHRVFRVPNDVGVSTAILGQGNLDSIAIQSEIPNLDVLPCGPLPPNPAELLHTKRFREIMAACASRYDRVIYDSPPTSAVTDPLIIGNLADGVVIVIRAGHTTRGAAAFARRQLSDAKAHVVGTIVNSVDPSDRYYNYYYSQYYRSYSYGGYSSASASASSPSSS